MRGLIRWIGMVSFIMRENSTVWLQIYRAEYTDVQTKTSYIANALQNKFQLITPCPIMVQHDAIIIIPAAWRPKQCKQAETKVDKQQTQTHNLTCKEIFLHHKTHRILRSIFGSMATHTERLSKSTRYNWDNEKVGGKHEAIRPRHPSASQQ